ncbi:hypothetical protein ACNJMW_12955 [Mycobacterium tuberculosis]
MASLRIAEVDPVDRSPNHHASGSVETSSSRSRSASVRACLIRTSRSSSCSARRMTSLLRSPLRIAALMICSSFSVGRKPMVAVMSTTIADVAQSYSNCSTHSGTPTPAFAASFLLDAINAPRVIAGRFASESVRFPAAAPHGSVPSRLPV